MAVCQYCQTLIAKDAESVKDLGKISQVIEDFSLIQIGSSGKFENRQFTVVGRIQLRYERGVWNEWYLYFDDGEPGWLSDSDGRYLITLPQGPCPSAPAFDSLGQGSNAACSLALKPDGGAIKRHFSPDTTLTPWQRSTAVLRRWWTANIRKDLRAKQGAVLALVFGDRPPNCEPTSSLSALPPRNASWTGCSSSTARPTPP